MTFQNYRRQSRDVQWGHESGSSSLSIEQINCGSLLRMADATEKMAASYDRLREDRDYWRRRAERDETQLATERRRVAALKGVLKKRTKP